MGLEATDAMLLRAWAEAKDEAVRSFRRSIPTADSDSMGRIASLWPI